MGSLRLDESLRPGEFRKLTEEELEGLKEGSEKADHPDLDYEQKETGQKIPELLKGKEAVIFDLDGTLVDSMWMWKQIDIEYLGRFGYECPPQLQKEIEGMSFSETAVYFKEKFQIPDSLEESAKLDGCGFFQTYIKIMLPLSKPVIAVVGLYTAVNHWNDWFAGAFYVNDTKLWPVQTVLQQMLTKAMNSQQEVTSVAQALAHNTVSVTSDSLKMAAVVVTTVPILCVYPFVQKYFAQGAMIGAVKG